MRGKVFAIIASFLCVGFLWGWGIVWQDYALRTENIYPYEQATYSEGEYSVGREYSIPVNRPVSQEGSKLYGQLGCAQCHSQRAVQNLWQSRSLSPEAWYEGGYSKSAKTFRVTLPDDYSGDYVAHFSEKKGAPEFSSLPHRIEERLKVIDGTGEERQYGTVREWLMLHLYHPQDQAFGQEGSPCPPLPFLFEEVSADSPRAQRGALPLDAPKGKRIVPTARAEQLVDYLLTLDKHSPVPMELKNARSKYLPKGGEFLFPSLGKKETLSKSDIMKRDGAKVFYNQCAVCHGRDGGGDGFNYPPLKDSEWLALPVESLGEIVLRGVRGPLMVKGKQWDNYMTPQGARLSDHELAAVVNHLLATFAPHRKESLSPEQVKALRERIDESKPFTSEELSTRIP